MVEAAQAFGIDRALEVGHAARLSIIIEELVYNLVDHGDIGEDGLIELVLTHEDGVVGIALSDSGVTFDPRGAESDEAIPERGGGAGIDLVRGHGRLAGPRKVDVDGVELIARHAVVVATPVTGVVERLAADDDRTRRHRLGEHLPAQPRRVEVRPLGDGLAEPLV